MRTTTIGSVAALLLLAGAAQAKNYADPGVIEIGGNVDFTSSSSTLKDDASGLKLKTTSSGVELVPHVNYFISKGFHAVVQVTIGSNTSKQDDGATVTKTTETDFTPGVGAGYFMDVGMLKVGPQLIIGIVNRTTKDDTSKVTTSGFGTRINVQAKSAVGGGGVLTGGLFYEMANVKDKVSGAEDKGKISNFGLEAGVSVFF